MNFLVVFSKKIGGVVSCVQIHRPETCNAISEKDLYIERGEIMR